jgi:hypothetical protein
MVDTVVTVAVRGLQDARSGSALPPFFGSTFSIKAKGGKTNNK